MYYDLRIVPEAFGCPFGLALGIVKHLLKNPKVETDNYIVADEKVGSKGEKIHHHFHFRFIADYKKDSLKKAIIRWFQEKEFKITGNAAFAVNEYNEPENVERWFRYCMKEKYLPELTKLTDWTDEKTP